MNENIEKNEDGNSERVKIVEKKQKEQTNGPQNEENSPNSISIEPKPSKVIEKNQKKDDSNKKKKQEDGDVAKSIVKQSLPNTNLANPIIVIKDPKENDNQVTPLKTQEIKDNNNKEEEKKNDQNKEPSPERMKYLNSLVNQFNNNKLKNRVRSWGGRGRNVNRNIKQEPRIVPVVKNNNPEPNKEEENDNPTKLKIDSENSKEKDEEEKKPKREFIPPERMKYLTNLVAQFGSKKPKQHMRTASLRVPSKNRFNVPPPRRNVASFDAKRKEQQENENNDQENSTEKKQSSPSPRTLKRKLSLRSLALISHRRFMNPRRKATTCACVLETPEYFVDDNNIKLHDVASISTRVILDALEERLISKSEKNELGVYPMDNFSKKIEEIDFHAFIKAMKKKFTDSEDLKTLDGIKTHIQKIFLNNLDRLLSSTPKNEKKQNLEKNPIVYKTSYVSDLGGRSSNEDQMCIICDVQNLFGFEEIYENVKIDFLCVLDGHAGMGCAKYGRMYLIGNIFENLDLSIIEGTKNQTYENLLSMLELALRLSFETTDTNFEDLQKTHKCNSGATCCAALIIHEECQNQYDILFANCGDSMGIIAENDKIIHETPIHKPHFPEEKKRIVESGGRVTFFYGKSQVNGLLAVSRSLGDIRLKTWVIPTPAVTRTTIKVEKDNDVVVILASDGLWDRMKPEDAVKYISENREKNVCVGKITKDMIGIARDGGSTDNATVIVHYL